MNRKFAILCACLGLAAASFGCEEEVASHFSLECSTAGEMRCENNAQQICSGTSWVTVTQCAHGCTGTTCKLDQNAECLVTMCKNATTLTKCSPDFKATDENCADGEECIVNTCKPKGAEPECKDGEQKCANGNILRICTSGVWIDMTCPSETPVCSIDKCIASGTNDCKSEERKCTDETHYQVCGSDNKWSDVQKCENETPLCDKGNCIPLVVGNDCTVGQSQCVGDTQYQVCNPDTLKWDAPLNCGGETPKCVSGVCLPIDVECKAGDSECLDDHTLKVCADNTWETMNCNDGEKCSVGQCVEDIPPVDICENGAVECLDDYTLHVCVDGIWAESTCTPGTVCDATSGKCVSLAVCTPAEIQCTNDAAGEYKVCTVDGMGWETGGKCNPPTPYCDSGVTPNACVSRCTRNTTRCTSDGVLQTCQRVNNINQWVDTPCDSTQTCKDNNGSASCVCIEGATKCAFYSNTIIQTCKADGTWEDAVCPNSKVCDSGISPAACANPCTENTKRCSADGDVQTCRRVFGSLQWQTTQDCNENETCKVEKDNASCVCTEGAHQCKTNYNQTSSQTCKAGNWTSNTTCKYGCNTETGICYECDQDGQINCSDKGIFRICKDHAWVEVEDCGAASACSVKYPNYGCCQPNANPVCSDNQSAILTCTTKKNDIKNLTYYGWTESTTCPNNGCKSGKNGVYCGCNTSDAPFCDGQNLYSCFDSKWVATTCDDNLVCDKESAACVCKDDTYRCENGDRQVCHNKKWETAKPACTKNQHCDPEEGAVCRNLQCNDAFDASITDKMLQDAGISRKDIGIACSGNSLLTCENGKYVVKQTCSRYCVRHDNGFAFCKNDYRCNSKLHRCDHSSSPQVMACDNNRSWNVDQSCEKGQKCIDYMTVVNGANPMNHPFVCNKTSCENNTYACNKDILAFCSGGELVDVADCASSGLVCNEGHCVKG
ncbi:MAG: hypothetical protein IJU23_04820 [Proteobacteria bacterium]|nr:hypothetical protein [Pseudomonadota bacterium]